MIFFDRHILFSKKFGQIIFSPVGKYVYSAAEDFGSINFRVVKNADFTFYELVMQVTREVDLRTTVMEGVSLLMPIEGELQLHIDGLDTEPMFTGECNFFHAPNAQISYIFRPGNFKFFGLLFNMDFLSKWRDGDFHFRKFLVDIEKGRARTLKLDHFQATDEVMSIAGSLFEESRRLATMYQYAKVTELLRLCILQSSVRVGKLPRLSSERAMFKLEIAVRHIRENLSAPGTVEEMAKEVGLPYHPFRENFKEVYGMTVYDFVEMERMKKAMELLKAGCVINYVSGKVGYKSPIHFSHAFERYFGYKPSRIQLALSEGKAEEIKFERRNKKSKKG